MPNENAEDTFFTDNTWVSLKKHSSEHVEDIFESWVPRVKWEFELKGHGHISAALLAQMDAHMSIDSNPLELIQIPVLQQFWKPKWFGTLDFPLGNLPCSLTPGVQFKAKFFHYGTFRGSLALGVNGHPKYKPKLQFDSFTGIRVDLHTKLREVTITPPNWMVSTSHFECGIALEPTIWIKGHLGNAAHNSKFAAALRPYFNMTITRAGKIHDPSDTMKELVLYPFRVVGLPIDNTKRYIVRIETRMPDDHCRRYHHSNSPNQMPYYHQGYDNQNAEDPRYYNDANSRHYGGYQLHKPMCDHFARRMDSTEALNYGEIVFKDPVRRFSFGVISQKNLMHLRITAQLIEVDYSTGKRFERPSDKISIRCKTILNGICQPSPMTGEIWFHTGSHVKIYTHAIWKDNPHPWFVTRIRGVAASFPEVIVNKEYIQQVVPGFNINSYVNTGSVQGSAVNKPLILALRHSDKSFPVLLDKHNGFVPGMNSSSLTTDMVLELGATFLSTWDRTCQSGTKKCDPTLVLYHGDLEIAKAEIPHIPWNGRFGRARSSFEMLFGYEAVRSRVVPVSVALKPTYQPNTGTLANWAHVGLVRMKFAIANPAGWNRWISPFQFTPVKAGTAFRLIWSLSHSHANKETTFNIITRKGVPQKQTTAASVQGATLGNTGEAPETNQYLRPRVGNMYFQEIGSEMGVTLTPIHDRAGGVHRTRFEHDVELGGAPGDIITVSVSWKDGFNHQHIMYSPPLLLESEQIVDAEEGAVEEAEGGTTLGPTNAEGVVGVNGVAPAAPIVAATTVAPAAPVGGRRLDFSASQLGTDITNQWNKWFGDQNVGWERNQNGQWRHQHYARDGWDADSTCARKDLNFAFGAGVMFRAYVRHLSLPSDLPVLGAIQSAPELGTPWETITGWESDSTDLKSKLPALLCRHGVCSATLPGCPQYSSVRHYYPEITIQFKHTLRYPHDSGSQADKWIPILKSALSYIFALMPEAITIVMHYTNMTTPAGTFDPNSAHRRRYQQFHNVMTGDDACENRGYDSEQCQEVGCCQWEADMEECHSAVGSGPCYKNGVVASAGLQNPHELNNPLAETGPTGPVATPVEPESSINSGIALPGTAAPSPVPFAGVSTTQPAGPVIAPLIGRRLDEAEERCLLDEAEEHADDADDEDTAEDDAEPKIERHLTGVSVQFKNGLKYEVDDLLMNAMIKEGLFKNLESLHAPADDDDTPVSMHSYTVRNVRTPTEDKPSVLEEVARSPVNALAFVALAAFAVSGVAFVVRRARHTYHRVDAPVLDQEFGPVE
jgi:hypothetical protein